MKFLVFIIFSFLTTLSSSAFAHLSPATLEKLFAPTFKYSSFKIEDLGTMDRLVFTSPKRIHVREIREYLNILPGRGVHYVGAPLFDQFSLNNFQNFASLSLTRKGFLSPKDQVQWLDLTPHHPSNAIALAPLSIQDNVLSILITKDKSNKWVEIDFLPKPQIDQRIPKLKVGIFPGAQLFQILDQMDSRILLLLAAKDTMANAFQFYLARMKEEHRVVWPEETSTKQLGSIFGIKTPIRQISIVGTTWDQPSLHLLTSEIRISEALSPDLAGFLQIEIYEI